MSIELDVIIEGISDVRVAKTIKRLFHFMFDRDRAHLRRHADIDIDRADAREVVRPVGSAALDGADIDLGP